MDADIDEVISFAICAIFGGRWLFRTGARLLDIDSLACGRGPRNAYVAMFVACLMVFLFALGLVATAEVRDNPFYWLLFLAATVVAIAAGVTSLGLLGLDALHDGLERNNPAVRIVVLALLPAITACSIGANIGEGSFVGTTLIPQAIAVALLVGFSALFSLTTESFTLIASDRDGAAAWRFASLLLAWGALFANSAHGDWISFAATLKSFGCGATAGALVLAEAVAQERWLHAATQPPTNLRSIIVPVLSNLAVGTALFCVLP